MEKQDAIKFFEDVIESGKFKTLTELYKIAVDALKKQIPMKPLKSGVTDNKGVFHLINGINGVPYDLCPSCGKNLCTDGLLAEPKKNYCSECGQRLDWS